MHWRQCVVVPGAQQLTGGAVPLPLRSPRLSPRLAALLSLPRAAASWCVRLAPHTTSNPLFTDGRPVSAAFSACRFTIVQI
ncbi:unnamed protein product [Pieris macdunnoughi]|uniref:Uncharacterized protein n=1 Tax=Pieris macdunnoughi TaxID=345717 RepID=A0A821XYP4_9NEOP|nr:unnamed protein product [Pieris macdunnoughi]